MDSFLYWIRIFTHDLINRITCVIMFIDSSDINEDEILKIEEVKNVNDFFIQSFNDVLNFDSHAAYKKAIIKFCEEKWLAAKIPDDMYVCCRLLYMFQLVFSEEYMRDEVGEYIEMLKVKIIEKKQWKYSFYLAVLCFVNGNNSGVSVTIDENILIFSDQIKLEKNIINCFVNIILKKQVIFDNNFIMIQ